MGSEVASVLVAQVAGHEYKLNRDFVVATDATFFLMFLNYCLIILLIMIYSLIMLLIPSSSNKLDDFYSNLPALRAI